MSRMSKALAILAQGRLSGTLGDGTFAYLKSDDDSQALFNGNLDKVSEWIALYNVNDSLYFSGTDLSVGLPALAATLSATTKVTRLVLDDCQLNDPAAFEALLAIVAANKSIEYLSLHHNRLTGPQVQRLTEKIAETSDCKIRHIGLNGAELGAPDAGKIEPAQITVLRNLLLTRFPVSELSVKYTIAGDKRGAVAGSKLERRGGVEDLSEHLGGKRMRRNAHPSFPRFFSDDMRKPRYLTEASLEELRLRQFGRSFEA